MTDILFNGGDGDAPVKTLKIKADPFDSGLYYFILEFESGGKVSLAMRRET